MSISRSYISEGMDVVDVSTEWILNISVILNATARDSTMVHTLVLLPNPVLTRRYSNSNHRINFLKMK